MGLLMFRRKRRDLSRCRLIPDDFRCHLLFPLMRFCCPNLAISRL